MEQSGIIMTPCYLQTGPCCAPNDTIDCSFRTVAAGYLSAAKLLKFTWAGFLFFCFSFFPLEFQIIRQVSRIALFLTAKHAQQFLEIAPREELLESKLLHLRKSWLPISPADFFTLFTLWPSLLLLPFHTSVIFRQTVLLCSSKVMQAEDWCGFLLLC